MGVIDILFIAILVIGFISGAQKGFLTSILACVALCVASLIAQGLYPSLVSSLNQTQFCAWLKVNLEAEEAVWNNVFAALSFTAIFIIASAALMLIVNLINNVFRMPKIRGVDGLLGGILGLVRAYAVICLIVGVLPVILQVVDAELVPDMFGEGALGSFFTSGSGISDILGIGAKIAKLQ